MKKSNSMLKAQSAFKKLGAVALITATLALFFTVCNQTGGGGGKPTPTPKHAITFSVDSTTPNGTLKVEGDGITQPATSPITVEEGKTVTFTATASEGCRLKGWTLNGNAVNGTAETYTLTVTQAARIKVSFEPNPVEGGAVLILSPNKLAISVTAKTADGSAITVEGCTETTLASDTKTTLNATGTRVVLKGKITELYCNGTYDSNQLLTSLNVQGLTALQKLYCSNNQLPELNVQGLTALQVLNCSNNKLPELNVQDLTALKRLYCSNNQLPELNVQGLTALQVLYCSNNYLTVLDLQGCTSLKELDCYSNQLNAKAMTELLNALPAREESDRASAILYTEDTSEGEGNCKDYTQPAELKAAFEDAKKRNWKLQKMNASESLEDL